MQKQALGKGLGALIPDLSSLNDKEKKALGISEIELDKIVPNEFQPRKTFQDDAMKELAASIKEHGVIQPIIVHRIGTNYGIIAGERRYRAAMEAGLSELPCVIRETSDAEMMELALVENLQRKDLTAFEEADGLKVLAEK